MNTDLLHKITNFIDHNRYTVISVAMFAILFAVVIGMVGCESKTTGLIASGTGQAMEVTRGEFARQTAVAQKDFAVKKLELDAKIAAYNKEIESFNSQVQAGIDDLDRKDAVKKELLDTVGVVITQASTSSLNPMSLLPLGIGLLGTALGLGASADNRRKDSVIANLKNSGSQNAT